MDEAINELRNAVHQALSLDPNDRSDELINSDVQVESSESTYISSLSGSLPSERSTAASSRRKLFYDSNGDVIVEGGHGWQRRRRIANRVENAVSSYELARFNFQSESIPSWINVPVELSNMNMNDDYNEGDVSDLLVAVMTSVPRNLLQHQLAAVWAMDSEARESMLDVHLAPIEQICFSAVCISSDILVKYFCQGEIICALPNQNPRVLDDNHVNELIDEVLSICEADPSTRGWFVVCSIVRVLNALYESRQMEQMMHEREGGYGDDNFAFHQKQLFSGLSAKETLRLAQILMHSFICGSFNQLSAHISTRKQNHYQEEYSSHIGVVIGYLLDHFSNMALMDTGCDSFENSQYGLFEAWSDGTDEHMVTRLNDNDARTIPGLIAQYHMESIQSASQMTEEMQHRSFILSFWNMKTMKTQMERTWTIPLLL
jgi:hypothetical protein